MLKKLTNNLVRFFILLFLLILIATTVGGYFYYRYYMTANISIPQTHKFKPTLSEYGLYQGKLADLNPSEGVELYELSSTLFSDYAKKQRLIRLPQGSSISLNPQNINDMPSFPDGTIIVKTFYYTLDEREPEKGKDITETRLLVKEKGEWNTATYVWNAEQTEAIYDMSAPIRPVQWIDKNGDTQQVNFAVPDAQACATCHQSDGKQMPLGPTLMNLNREVKDKSVNQLTHFQDLGLLEPFGIGVSLSDVETLTNYLDNTQPLENRARAYLDVNCSSCHRPNGYKWASDKGYDFRYSTPYDDTGIRGSEAMILYQMASLKMPYIGVTRVDEEGYELLKEYFSQTGMNSSYVEEVEMLMDSQ